MFEDKVIFISGMTGSFGSAFSKEIINAKKVICFSRCWLKQKQLRETLNNPPNFRWFIGDVRDKDRLIRATKDVDIIIHAAAIKCLDACEYNPSEAMLTNVTGTQNVIDACIENKVGKCLLISTDKAVAPINTYGTSKAMAERLWINANRYSANDDIKFSVCRYGNVVGSNGSIIPIFEKMIADGRKILPITHPEMTRFWMEMPNVLKFVKESLENMQGEETFIPILPSVLITDICKAYDMPYEIIGIRQGEKLHETMGQEYDSGNNPWFLTVDEIKKSIENLRS